MLAKELGFTTENRPGFTILVALVAHRTPTLTSRLRETILIFWNYLLTSVSYFEYLRAVQVSLYLVCKIGWQMIDFATKNYFTDPP